MKNVSECDQESRLEESETAAHWAAERRGKGGEGRDETILPTTAAEIEDCLRHAKDDCVALIVASQDEGDFNPGLETGERCAASYALSARAIRLVVGDKCDQSRHLVRR